MAGFTNRLATMDDLDALREVMRRSIATLQTGFLTPEQVRVSHAVMGLDTQLIMDGTYFMVERGDRIAGCGGWSWRSTLYGGDESMVSREPEALDPAKDAARIRAMYTDPDFARQGVGRIVMGLCEGAAMDAGFKKAVMMATMSGVPLYEACGYVQVEPVLSAPVDGIRVPLVRMAKRLGR
jgi:GNAT superfamily N-acetyltransferase